MATIPLDTMGPTIDSAGISIPTYADVLETLKYRARQIFGADIYLEPDSQDGQMLAIFARAISDCNDGAVGSFNNMSPLLAVGAGLSSVVKINGIARALPTNSTVNVEITGQVGTTINNGQARDISGNIWKLPASVTIPGSGTITVTATAANAGAVYAEANTVNSIATPRAGWNTVNNPAAATVGQPVESDAALRRRQADSVALPAMSMLASLQGAIKDVPGVALVRIYVNDTNATDANGIPAKTLACVVQGGVASAVATAIMQKRTPGVGLFGSTTVVLVNNVGESESIKFTVPTQVTAKTAINLTALTGYTSDVGDKIKAALKAYYDALPIGTKVYWAKALSVASVLAGDPDAATFEINTFQLFRDADSPAQNDIAIDWDERPVGNLGNIAITVV